MEQRVPTALRDRLRGMLIQPNQTMATVAPNLTEGALIVVGLIVIAGIRVALEVAYAAKGNTVGFAIGGAGIGISMAWVSLTLLLRLIARALGGTGNYRNLLALMGYASIPMILTTWVSIVIFIVSPVLLPNLGGTGWSPLHTLIGWIGMAWGWPGVLSYYALRHSQRLSAGRAGSIVAVVHILMLLGWFLPVLVPGWFG
ncbi:MAG: YIP1 family protein [Chloroflexi bacterium]|nr:YIP1 family protein [Chloroflexota bacterium]